MTVGLAVPLGDSLPGARLPVCVWEMLAVRRATVGETLGLAVEEGVTELDLEVLTVPEGDLLTEGELVPEMVREGEAVELGQSEELTLVLTLRVATLELLTTGETL